MSIGRNQLEVELVSRRKMYLTAVEMSVLTHGSNADLNGPIGYAIRQSGGTVANPSMVADSDLSSFADGDYDQLADLAEYRLLMNVKGRWGKVDIKACQLSENLSQFADQLDKDIQALKEHLVSVYGIGSETSLTTGVLDLNFAEHLDG
jgi:hypothetical protein